jgi:uncharacterized protein (DUF58 family)
MGILFLFFFVIGISEFFSWVLYLSFFTLGLLDYILVFHSYGNMVSERNLAELLSNGDENPVEVSITNNKSFPIAFEMIDELPFQLQIRDFFQSGKIEKGETQRLHYSIFPKKRGEYTFGNLLVYVSSPLGLVKRRYSFEKGRMVPCYPSIIQMEKYALIAASRFASNYGIKRVRRLGHSLEFEQIKDYTQGDDIRALNWKATARKGSLMVNHFEDEKAQPVYCLLDKGRAMRMSFEGLSLMDYAINSSLAISNIALQKGDKVGFLSFSDQISTYIPANNIRGQLKKFLVGLYNQKTSWGESSFESLYLGVREKIKQRSLLILFSEFDSLASLKRQLPYLKRLNRFHLVLVVFFQDHELEDILQKPTHSLKGIYLKTITAKFSLEKHLIARELEIHGLLPLLTHPKNLTLSLINKYLEIKNQGKI